MELSNVNSDLFTTGNAAIAAEAAPTPTIAAEAKPVVEPTMPDIQTENMLEDPQDRIVAGYRPLKQGADFGEAFKTKWEMEAENRPLEEFSYAREIYELRKRGKTMSIEELDKQFPGKKWKESTTEEAAKFIYDHELERARKQAIVDQADVGTLGKIGLWSGGLVSSLMDPVAAAALLLTAGVGEAGVAAYGIKSAAGKFGMTVLENVMGGMAIEPFRQEAAAAAQEDYSWMDYAMNVGGTAVAGTAVFGSLGFGIKQGLKMVSKASDIALRAIENGHMPGTILDDLFAKTNDNLKINKVFSNVIIDTFGEAGKKYIAGPNILDSVELIGQDFGNGTISEGKFNEFMVALRESGLDKEVDNAMRSDAGLSDTTLSSTKTDLSNPDRQIGVDLKEEKLPIPTTEQVTAEMSRSKVDADMALAKMTSNPEIYNAQIVEQVVAKAQKEDSLVKASDILSECYSGGGM